MRLGLIINYHELDACTIALIRRHCTLVSDVWTLTSNIIMFYGNNAVPIPGACDSKRDFGARYSGSAVGYGSMQIHNFKAGQTVFGYNNFANSSNADLGIGSCLGKRPD